MKIAIIGAGFTGLSAAFELTKLGHDVSVFEKDLLPGGLAIGYQEKDWDWSLEKHYHHWFTNDKSVLDLCKEINFDVLIKRPKTTVFIKNKIYQLDSPISVLKFPLLSLVQRLRMSAVIGFLKFNPYWLPLEKYKASKVLPKLMGEKPYEMIWEPLFVNKFGNYSDNISLAWFWARITKRTPSLAYPKGGFLNFANTLVKEIKKRKGKVFFETEILELKNDKKLSLVIKNKDRKIQESEFEKIIITTPSFLFLKIAKSLPDDYKNKLGKLKGLGATNYLGFIPPTHI
jgi:protoporphyrinogen oxidase